MSGLPPGWAWATVRELAAAEPASLTDGPFGSNLKTEHYVSDPGPRVIRLQNIGDGFFKGDDQAFISRERFESLERHDARPGDVLVAALGDILPRACLVPEDIGPAIVKADCFRLRPARGISARLIQYLLNSPQARDAATHLISGVGRPRLNLGKVGDISLPVAPAKEQERIVAAIDEQFSRVDAGVAALHRCRQNLTRMRAAVLQAAVTGALVPPSSGEAGSLLERAAAERRKTWSDHTLRPYREVIDADAFPLTVPGHWRVTTLEALTHPVRVICYGILMPRVKQGGVVPYVEVKDLRAKKLSVATLHRTSSRLHEEFPRSVLAAGDVVLAIRGSYDRALVVPRDVAGSNVSRDVARIAPLDQLNADFLAAYLTSPPALQYLREHARGVAVKGVNIADLRSMPVPLPPMDEQRRIADEVDRYMSILDQVLATAEDVDARGDRLRSSILADAFSGGLVAQDSNEEPASLMLERIASERATSNGQGAGMKRARRTKVTA